MKRRRRREKKMNRRGRGTMEQLRTKSGNILDREGKKSGTKEWRTKRGNNRGETNRRIKGEEKERRKWREQREKATILGCKTIPASV